MRIICLGYLSQLQQDKQFQKLLFIVKRLSAFR
nr:MAG TPA: hypothetical protein [Caudoviricetes sp.]